MKDKVEIEAGSKKLHIFFSGNAGRDIVKAAPTSIPSLAQSGIAVKKVSYI